MGSLKAAARASLAWLVVAFFLITLMMVTSISLMDESAILLPKMDHILLGLATSDVLFGVSGTNVDR